MSLVISAVLYGAFLFFIKFMWGITSWTDPLMIMTALDYYFLGFLFTTIFAYFYAYLRHKESPGCGIGIVWPYAVCLIIYNEIKYSYSLSTQPKIPRKPKFDWNMNDKPDRLEEVRKEYNAGINFQTEPDSDDPVLPD